MTKGWSDDKYILENTECDNKKGQFRESGNIGYTIRRKHKKGQHNVLDTNRRKLTQIT